MSQCFRDIDMEWLSHVNDHLETRRRVTARANGSEGATVRLSSIFKWYGSEFDARFSALGPEGRSVTDRALLGVLAAYGPQPHGRWPGRRAPASPTSPTTGR